MLVEIAIITYITFLSLILLLLVWAISKLNKRAERHLLKTTGEPISWVKNRHRATPKHGRKRAILAKSPNQMSHF